MVKAKMETWLVYALIIGVVTRPGQYVAVANDNENTFRKIQETMAAKSLSTASDSSSKVADNEPLKHVSDDVLKTIIADSKKEVHDEEASSPNENSFDYLPKYLQMLHHRQLSNPEGEKKGVEAKTLIRIMSKLADYMGLTSAKDVQRLNGFQSDLLKRFVCAPERRLVCKDLNSKFRTLDGTCNNKRNPRWGSANQPMRRIVHADYYDGYSQPRKSRFPRYPLPNARTISLKIFQDNEKLSPKLTDMSMVWGQFLDHDLTHGKQPTIRCPMGPSNTNCDTPTECFGIKVPRGDRKFTAGSCLPVKRDVPSPQSNCRLSVREQLNELTAFIDASHVYGNSKNVSNSLRKMDGSGTLKCQDNPNPNLKDLLSITTTRFCNNKKDPSKGCFRSGDGRTNENSGLSSMHTIIHREHNRIALRLKQINSHWNGEKIFQETRKIIGAIMQHITFNEFIPLILNQRTRQQYDLVLKTHGYYTGYDSNVDAGIINSFAAAAYRFGHSQVRNVIKRLGMYHRRFKDIDMKEFINPIPVYDNSNGGVDSILRGLASARSERVDGNFAKAITDSLLLGAGKHNIGDLPAINIQRGREHGLPGYNEYRKLCGLRVARTFHEFANISPKRRYQLKRLYVIPDNVDLFVGGILERPLYGGSVGETFSCILGKQFQALRKGDRFWYENNNVHIKFSPSQLQEIRKVTLARVICDNSDNIRNIQPRVLKPASHNRYSYYGNYPQHCTQLPRMDLRQWVDQQVGQTRGGYYNRVQNWRHGTMPWWLPNNYYQTGR